MKIISGFRTTGLYGVAQCVLSIGNLFTEKAHLTKRDLLDRFAAVSGVQEETDAVLLS